MALCSYGRPFLRAIFGRRRRRRRRPAGYDLGAPQQSAPQRLLARLQPPARRGRAAARLARLGAPLAGLDRAVRRLEARRPALELDLARRRRDVTLGPFVRVGEVAGCGFVGLPTWLWPYIVNAYIVMALHSYGPT